MIAALIVLATFFVMEFMAWFAHKYIMHGFMWYFHEDHHVHEPGFFEKNDVFFLIFAIPSALCFITGAMNGGDFRVWIGTGIALYGLAYFLVHDVFIHQRFKWFKRSNHPTSWPFARPTKCTTNTSEKNTASVSACCSSPSNTGAMQ